MKYAVVGNSNTANLTLPNTFNNFSFHNETKRFLIFTENNNGTSFQNTAYIYNTDLTLVSSCSFVTQLKANIKTHTAASFITNSGVDSWVCSFNLVTCQL